MKKLNKNLIVQDGENDQIDEFTEKEIEKQLGIKDPDSYSYKEPIKKKKRKSIENN